jgi:chromosome segregation ATPase
MNSDNALTAVEAAEQTLGRLQRKRAGIVARVAEISHERQSIGFAVHSEGDPKARKRLDILNAETVSVDGELQSLDAAVSEAQRRLEAAQRELAQREDAENAKAVKKTLVRLLKLAEAADEHLAAFGMISSEIKSTVDELHGLGQAMPTSQQTLTFCSLATQSMLMFLPWATTAEFRHLAPSERRTFSKLFADWAAAANRNLDLRISVNDRIKEDRKQEVEHHHASA